MSTNIPLKNAGYLLQLKEQLDEIVFNYIDTSKSWEVAYSKLNVLLEKATSIYEGLKESKGDKSWGSTTAILFLNVSYKLIYFHTISYYYSKDTNKEEAKEQALELLNLAAGCIPDVQKVNHAEYIHEIAKSYEEISSIPGKQQEFEKLIIAQNNSIEDCFNFYLKATSLFLK